MPQTREVLKKSLALGLKPIVVINKIDRSGTILHKKDEFNIFIVLIDKYKINYYF